jgi:hypothetical protein
MQIDDLNSNNLGDLTGALPEHQEVVDFSWLSPTNGEDKDNYPSDSEREIIPQLNSEWRRDLSTSPNPRIEGQKAAVPGKAKDKSSEDKYEVERVAKKAMMMGLSGREMITHLRERFSSEQIALASEELKRVAAEDGLLGNVYLDLGAFNTTKEALSTLGHHKIRLASCAVGSPIREKNFVDPSGKCLHLAKMVVDKVEYTGALLAHYANHLKNIGAIPKDASIEDKESLRVAFLQARSKRASAEPLDSGKTPSTGLFDTSEEVLDKGQLDKLNNYAASQQNMVRLAKIRPVLAKIQGLMLAGAQGDDLKQGIKACCDSETIQEFAPEISGLVSRQGIIGPVVVDTSLYNDAPSAVSAISKASVKPLFIVSTLPTQQEGLAGYVSSRTGIPLMKGPEDLTHAMAAKAVSNMNGAGQIDDETASSLVKLAGERSEKPVAIIRMAAAAKGKKSDKFTKIEKKDSKAAPASVSQSYRAEKDGEKANLRKDLKKKSEEALTRGVKASALQTKVASYVPIGEAIGIVREAIAAMDLVSADALDECHTTKYDMKKTARLVVASKCHGCTFMNCNTCSKQARSFRMANTKMASVSKPQVNPVADMGLSNSMVDMDLSGVIIPARRPVGMDIDMPGAHSMGDIQF